VAAAVGCLLLLLAAATPAAASPPPAPKLASLIGQAAPDFTLPTVAGLKVKLADFKGCVVVVDFWTTSCPPCIAVLQHFQHLSDDQSRRGKGLRILAINFGEPASRVAAFLKKNNFTLTVPLDAQGTVAQSYHVVDIPHTVLIGRDGTVKQTFLGFDEQISKEIDQAVDQALEEKK
jgi:peroxiredoxin